MDYQFLEYSPSYKAQITELRARAFGGNVAFNAEYLAWKFERNPYLDEPNIYIVLCEGEVVAMRGYYGTRWQVASEEETLVIPASCELAVDAEHRRSGLGYRVQVYSRDEMLRKGYQYLMNLSANNSSRRLQIRSDFRRVAVYNKLWRDDSSETNANGSSLPFQGFDAWAEQTERPIIGTTEPRYAAMAALVSESEDDSRLHLVRDEEFYRWRLLNPASEYRFVYFDGGGSLDGFVVLHQPRFGGWTTIVDWQARTPSIWLQLVGAVVESTPRQLIITSTSLSKDETQSLIGLGFQIAELRDTQEIPAPGMLLHTGANRATDELRLGEFRARDADSWDIRMIASDEF